MKNVLLVVITGLVIILVYWALWTLRRGIVQPAKNAQMNEAFTLKIGESARIGSDFTIKLIDVVEDGRCAAFECFATSPVVARVEISHVDRKQVVYTGNYNRPVSLRDGYKEGGGSNGYFDTSFTVVDGYTVKIMQVDPARFDLSIKKIPNPAIPKSKYVLTFVVHR